MQFTLVELWGHMGLFAKGIVVVLFIMSIGSLVVAAERFIVLRRSNGESKAFAGRMSTVLADGDLDAAADTKLGSDVGHLGRVIKAGLGAYKTAPPGDNDLTFESVARALDRQSAREVQTLRKGSGLLATVGSTAPFVGLLGTVMGIVNAFQSMAASGSGGLGTVSAGIAEALITTAFGLFVAVPAVWAYNYFAGKVEGFNVEMDNSSSELLDYFIKKGA